MASIDQIIGGSFESLGLPRLSQSEQLQWLRDYSQANPTLAAYNTAAAAPPVAKSPMASSVPMMTAYAPQQAQSPAVAAATAAGGQPITSVTGQMKPTGWRGFDLMSLLTGPSKNGLGGLAGLLGGPQQGGILQMLLGGGKSTTSLPRQAPAMTSAQKYAALNSGPGSVAAMEAWHGGGSSSQSGSPAGTREYASGGRA